MRVKKEIAVEFVRRLKELMKLERRADFSSNDWQKLSRDFVGFVRSNQSALDLMEEEIWHYTSDLGIRKKDREYAERQRDYVQKRIDAIERDLCERPAR